MGAVVVGTGFGPRVHVPALRAARVDVVALVGTDPAKTERLAAEAGIERTTASLWSQGEPLVFTAMEIPPAVVQAGILRDLVAGVPPQFDHAPPATFADGLRCIEVLDAIRRSAAEDGARVALP